MQWLESGIAVSASGISGFIGRPINWAAFGLFAASVFVVLLVWDVRRKGGFAEWLNSFVKPARAWRTFVWEGRKHSTPPVCNVPVDDSKVLDAVGQWPSKSSPQGSRLQEPLAADVDAMRDA